MTMRRLLLRALPLSFVLTAFGCAAPTSDPPTHDDLTEQERQDGDAWVAAGGAEADTDGDADPSEPSELTNDDRGLDPQEVASDAYFENEDDTVRDADGALLPPLDPAELDEIKACRRAAGYRKGKRITICVTTVNGKLVEVNTARAFLRMRKAAKAKGVSIVVNSGFRTMAKQRYLYNCYKTKKCNNGNLAAPPGYSNHQSGHALDLNTASRGVYSYLARHGSAYRFKRTVPSERWHWERW